MRGVNPELFTLVMDSPNLCVVCIDTFLGVFDQGCI